MNKPFTREPRYIVVKSKDADAALSATELNILRIIARKVERWRTSHGKTNLSGVFVEHDWPEHEPVWKMIEQRTTAADTTPPVVGWPRPYPPKDAPLVWPDLICEHDWVRSTESTHRTCVYCKKSEPLEQPA